MWRVFGVLVVSVTADRNCERMDATMLRTLPREQRAMLLTRPTIVTGLIEDWPAYRSFGTPDDLVERVGEYGILAKRTYIGTSAARVGGNDPSSSLMRIRDLKDHLDKVHVVLYPGEPGNAETEEELVATMALQTSVPDILMRTQALVVSLGGGTDGVQMAQHGFAWIGIVAGRKRWYLDHPDETKPTDPDCSSREEDQQSKSEVICTQGPGEVVIVPTTWWHATCNVEPYTLGIGGQDSCDITDCTPPGPPDESPMELHMRKKFCRSKALAESCFAPATYHVPHRPERLVNATWL